MARHGDAGSALVRKVVGDPIGGPGPSHVAVLRLLRGGVTAWLLSAPCAAQLDFQYQLGRLTNPFTATREYTSILTIQHAGSWKYGDSFFFADMIEDRGRDGFNDKDIYTEWYPTLSFGKMAGRRIGLGPIRDISAVGGINFGKDPKVLKFLPGLRASWNVPGFVFLNTDFTAFIDASSGVARGGAPRTSNSFMIDVSWLLPIAIGGQSFAFMGHAEHIGKTTDEFGAGLNGWILAQPQFTWDLGAAIWKPNRLLLGIEYQYWLNKLGTNNHDNVAQLLVIWRP